MPQPSYTVEQFQRQWVVSVGGNRVLTCKTKRMALRAARNAMVLLHRSQCADETMSRGSDEPFGRVGTVFRKP
jgi:hypothetical protein